MPANTIDAMILGFSVILGSIVLYVGSLFLRIRQARKQLVKRQDTLPPLK